MVDAGTKEIMDDSDADADHGRNLDHGLWMLIMDDEVARGWKRKAATRFDLWTRSGRATRRWVDDDVATKSGGWTRKYGGRVC